MLYYEIDEGVELRLVEERYAEELTSVVKKNCAYLEEWLPWANKDYDEKFATDFLKRKLNNLAEGNELSFFIFCDKKIIGLVSLFKIDKVNKSGEIGYWITEDAQGKGIITKCSEALIKHGFDELNLNRIVIICATGNAKSQGVPKRLKFQHEGVLRQSHRLHEGFVDLIVYSLLKEEWGKR